MRQINQRKLGTWRKNLSMWNDLKKDNKIIFKTEVNIINNEIRIIRLLRWIIFFT